MSAPRRFVSPLAPAITGFLALKRALGRGYAKEETICHALDRYLAAQPGGPVELTASTFAAFSTLSSLHLYS